MAYSGEFRLRPNPVRSDPMARVDKSGSAMRMTLRIPMRPYRSDPPPSIAPDPIGAPTADDPMGPPTAEDPIGTPDPMGAPTADEPIGPVVFAFCFSKKGFLNKWFLFGKGVLFAGDRPRSSVWTWSPGRYCFHQMCFCCSDSSCFAAVAETTQSRGSPGRLYFFFLSRLKLFDLPTLYP